MKDIQERHSLTTRSSSSSSNGTVVPDWLEEHKEVLKSSINDELCVMDFMVAHNNKRAMLGEFVRDSLRYLRFLELSGFQKKELRPLSMNVKIFMKYEAEFEAVLGAGGMGVLEDRGLFDGCLEQGVGLRGLSGWMVDLFCQKIRVLDPMNEYDMEIILGLFKHFGAYLSFIFASELILDWILEKLLKGFVNSFSRFVDMRAKSRLKRAILRFFRKKFEISKIWEFGEIQQKKIFEVFYWLNLNTRCSKKIRASYFYVYNSCYGGRCSLDEVEDYEVKTSRVRLLGGRSDRKTRLSRLAPLDYQHLNSGCQSMPIQLRISRESCQSCQKLGMVILKKFQMFEDDHYSYQVVNHRAQKVVISAQRIPYFWSFEDCCSKIRSSQGLDGGLICADLCLKTRLIQISKFSDKNHFQKISFQRKEESKAITVKEFGSFSLPKMPSCGKLRRVRVGKILKMKIIENLIAISFELDNKDSNESSSYHSEQETLLVVYECEKISKNPQKVIYSSKTQNLDGFVFLCKRELLLISNSTNKFTKVDIRTGIEMELTTNTHFKINTKSPRGSPKSRNKSYQPGSQFIYNPRTKSLSGILNNVFEVRFSLSKAALSPNLHKQFTV